MTSPRVFVLVSLFYDNNQATRHTSFRRRERVVGADFQPRGSSMSTSIRRRAFLSVLTCALCLWCAQAFAQSDPYMLEGVFERVEVKPFRKVFPET